MMQSFSRPKSFQIDRFFRDEPVLWKDLKSTDYYESLQACASGEQPLPFKYWLRFMLHVPSTLEVDELVRVFDEEDTVTVMATVSPPPDKAMASLAFALAAHSMLAPATT